MTERTTRAPSELYARIMLHVCMAQPEDGSAECPRIRMAETGWTAEEVREVMAMEAMHCEDAWMREVESREAFRLNFKDARLRAAFGYWTAPSNHYGIGYGE